MHHIEVRQYAGFDFHDPGHMSNHIKQLRSNPRISATRRNLLVFSYPISTIRDDMIYDFAWMFAKLLDLFR